MKMSADPCVRFILGCFAVYGLMVAYEMITTIAAEIERYRNQRRKTK